MPVYEFRCNPCGNRFEELVMRIGATAPCPRCGSCDVARLMSSFSARSKSGSGEYKPVTTSSGCGSCTSSSCSGCGK